MAAGYPDVAAEPVAFGDAGFFGSMAGVQLNAPVVGMAATPDAKGYWLVASDGGVFSFGDAGSYGSMGGQKLSRARRRAWRPLLMARATGSSPPTAGSSASATPSSSGRWEATHLDAPIVGMAATPGGRGYWLVASDGGVFSFGDAALLRAPWAAQRLTEPVVGMAGAPGGGGYWLVASDGGVFSFGDAPFLGSMGAVHLNAPVVGMAATPSGRGLLAGLGRRRGVQLRRCRLLRLDGRAAAPNPITAIAATPDGGGYWLLPSTESPVGHPCTRRQRTGRVALQQRLSSLGYWLGTPDGAFGDTTEQAVYALQKAAGITRNGIVGPATQAALAEGVVPQPRSTSGYVIEVDLEDDLVMFVTNGKLD